MGRACSARRYLAADLSTVTAPSAYASGRTLRHLRAFEEDRLPRTRTWKKRVLPHHRRIPLQPPEGFGGAGRADFLLLTADYHDNGAAAAWACRLA